MSALAFVLAADEIASAVAHAALVADLAEHPQFLVCEACQSPCRTVRQHLGHALDEAGPQCCDNCHSAALAAAFDAVDAPRARDLIAAAYEHAVKVMRRDVERGAA